MDTLHKQLSLALHHLCSSNRRPVGIDLFAGAGGFSLGMEQAGFDVLVAVEYDPIHACTYAYNFPHTEVICSSVTDISATEIQQAAIAGWKKHRQFSLPWDNSPRPWDRQIDVVFGGPPCQGFSVIGKRNFDDERNSLIFHFLRIVCALHPRFFIMENVPGLATKKYKVILEDLQDKFIRSGYWLQASCLNAADFGVPQRRKRLFLIGGQQGDDVKLLLSHLQPVLFRTTVGDAIDDLPDIDGLSELASKDEYLLDDRHLQLIAAKTTSYIQFLRPHPVISSVISNVDINQHNFRSLLSPTYNHQIYPSPNQCKHQLDVLDLSYPRQWNPRLLTSSMQTQHRETSRQRYSQLRPGELEPISRLRRLDWNGVSHTLRAGTDSSRGRHTSPRPIHPRFARVISVREAARLHSFPDWFRFHQTKWHGFRQVGNSVPPLLARGIGEAIVKTMGLKLTTPGIIYPTKLLHKQVESFPDLPSENFRFASCLALGNPQMLKFNPAQARNFWN